MIYDNNCHIEEPVLLMHMRKSSGVPGETEIQHKGKPGAYPNNRRPPEKRPPFSFLPTICRLRVLSSFRAAGGKAG